MTDLARSMSYPYVEVWERISVRHQIWERSFDKGKTWKKVDLVDVPDISVHVD